MTKKYNYEFEIQCDKRQLPIFQGTAIVKAEKMAKTNQKIDNFKANEEEQDHGLTSQQKSRQKSTQTSLRLLENNDLFTPSKRPIYQGNPNIFLGGSMGLENVFMIALMDIGTGKRPTYRNPKQLLNTKRQILAKQASKVSQSRPCREITDYQLFTSLRQKRQRYKHKRYKAQKRGISNAFQESNQESRQRLYINRQFAQQIIKFAQEHQVSTIILPDLKYKREIIQAELKAAAELKFPNNKALQDEYIKDPLMTVNDWNYGQLRECISRKATLSGINVEIVRQTDEGNLYDKARELIQTFVVQQEIAQSISTPSGL